MQPQRDRLLTTSAAARLVDRSETYIRKLADTGRLPVERATNGARIFRQADIAQLARELSTAEPSR